MRDRHGTPFEHSSMTFYVRAPIFVFREFMRHRTFSYNEESGRYRRLEPEFYVPGPARKLVQQGKPGAYEFTDGTPAQHKLVDEAVRKSCRAAYAAYLEMLDAGVAREVARTVLPVGIYSSMYATCNARALMNFLPYGGGARPRRFPRSPSRRSRWSPTGGIYYRALAFDQSAVKKSRSARATISGLPPFCGPMWPRPRRVTTWLPGITAASSRSAVPR